MALIDFYHYSSEAAIDAIINSGIINESLDGGTDAHFGRGVYGTGLPPHAGKRAIAKNNYLAGWKNREKKGRVDYAIHLKIPKSQVQNMTTSTRNILLHKGPIYINQYVWEVIEV